MYASDLRHSNMTLQDKLRHLYGLSRGGTIALDFRPPYLNLLKAFGDPQRALPPVIHVAGTNGKGSVVAAMKGIFEAAGYRVHAYTSPHLLRFNERIVLQGRAIDDAALEDLIDTALRLNDGAAITFFEITTAMAFAAFARAPADILLLETGMGGRLDCTNVVAAPRVTVITGICFDHREFLGETLQAIATEKAGIMKRGVACVLGPQERPFFQEDAFSVFESRARALNAPLYRAGADWVIAPEENRFTLGFRGQSYALPLPALAGRHQIDNAATACIACLCAGEDFSITQAHMAQGLRHMQWPGRLQNLTAQVNVPGREIWLDGAHNAQGARALAAQAAQWQARDGRDLHLVLGMMAHKDPVEFLEPLAPYLQSVTVVDIPQEPKAWPAAVLHAKIAAAFPALPCAQASSAWEAARAPGAEGGRMLIAGSLYLVADMLKHLRS